MEAKNILFAFTEMGRQTAGRIVQALGLPPEGVRCFVPERLQADGFEGFENLAQVVGTLFAQAETLVFVGAAGIAVRAAAPYLESKLTDPAVIVVDEQARYVIPILSGHVGGANAYAQHLAVLLGALQSFRHKTANCRSSQQRRICGISFRSIPTQNSGIWRL